MSKLLFTIDTIAAPDSYAQLLQRIIGGRASDSDLSSLHILSGAVEYLGVVTDLSAPRQSDGAPEEANHAPRSQQHESVTPVKAIKIFRVEEGGQVVSYDVQYLVEKLERGCLEEFLEDVFGDAEDVEGRIPE